ncbi:MAG: TIGR00730 family Rossman fold protein [Bacteroidales bacterium]|nr:TIGR00730 family Rossman fold protein [Bacteroidales bacterium]
MKLSSFGVFCGSSMGFNPEYAKAAEDLAEIMLSNNISLYYGGANIGLMKIIADAIYGGNGTVVGVMPFNLAKKNIVSDKVTHMIYCSSLAERKNIIISNADAFIAMPGGFGTLDEITDVLTLTQLNVINKPIALLNVNGYYDAFLKQLDKCADEGFLRTEHRANIIDDVSPTALVDKIFNFTPVEVDSKWVDYLKHQAISQKGTPK